MYKNPWKYKNKNFYTKDIGEAFGFVYCITNKKTGRRYIGRKYFYTLRKPRKGGRRVRKESNWKDYYGSSKELLADIECLGVSSFRRDILHLCQSAALTNYMEVKEQFLCSVLESDEWYNGNINGKYHSISRYFE